LKLKNLVELLVLFFLDFSGSNVRVIGTSGVGARLLFDLVRPIGVIYVFFIDGATYISGQIFEAIIGFDGRRFNNILYRLFGSVLAPVVISFMLFFTSIVALVCLFVGFLLKLVSHSRIIAITGVFNASYRNIFIAHRPPIRVWLLSIFGVLLYYMSAFSWYYLFNRYYYYNRHHPFGHGWLWSDSPYNGCAIPPSLATQVSPFGGVFSNFSLFEWFNAHSVLLARLQYLVGISGDSVLRTVYYQVEIVYIIAGIILLVSFVFRNSQQSSSFLGRTL
jgi:hypothetical protein